MILSNHILHFLRNIYIFCMMNHHSHRHDLISTEEVKYALQPKPKILQINIRNHSSSKLLKTNYFDLESTSKNLQEHQKFIDHLLPNIENQDHKSYQTNRFKLSNQKQRRDIIRKNASLKLLRREEGLKAYNRSRVDEIKNCENLNFLKDDKSNNEAQSLKSIPLKKPLLKKSHNLLRIEKRNVAVDRQDKKSDVSFQDCLEKAHISQEKALPNDKICSENLLGNGMRKYSSVKMKALVTNPFQRHIRHQQEIKEQQSHIINEIQATDFKQSQIFTKHEESFRSATQQQQIQELLRLL